MSYNRRRAYLDYGCFYIGYADVIPRIFLGYSAIIPDIISSKDNKLNELKDKLIADNISEDECNLLFDELIRKPIISKVPTVNLVDYPQLKLLCWNHHLDTMDSEEALYRYEHHWTLIDEKALIEKELNLINQLQVDKTIYLEFYPYKSGEGKTYQHKKLLRFINKSK